MILPILLFSNNFSAFSQTTKTYYPSGDATIAEGNSATNYGSSSTINIQSWTNYVERSLIRFDLSSIPSSSASGITSATLRIYWQNTNGASKTIEVHRITQAWEEGSVTWDNRKTSTAWNSGGGDFSSTVLATKNISWYPPAYYDIDLTSSVKDFVDGTYTNYGWILKFQSENTAQKYWDWHSKETSTGSKKPSLIITSSAPLPVELTRFEGEVKKEGVSLEWETATEMNNHYFSVERKINDRPFHEIASVEGNGTTIEPRQYHYTDSLPGISPNRDELYYRLKQVDFDGQYEYSRVISVAGPGNDKKRKSWNIYPNPVRNGEPVHITFNKGHTVLMVHDNKGMVIKNFSGSGSIFKLNTNNLLPGIYFIKNKTGTARKLYITP